MEGDVSQFGALTTALSSTIGTGNIIGVGTAITLGGPGAVLWMWLTGIFGMATKYAETLIAVKYRVKSEDGTMIGGAMYALDRGLNMRWLGIIFAALASVCAFGIGSTVQANAVAENLKTNFGFNQYVIAIVLSALVALVIIGGIKSITNVAEKLVPFMALFYVVGCIVILIINHDVFGETVMTIIKGAFNPKAVGGGFAGATVDVAAFVAEEFYFVFLEFCQAGKFVKGFVQAEVWDYVFEVWAVQFCAEVIKVCENFCC